MTTTHTGKTFLYRHDPYGWVRLVDACYEELVDEYLDYNNGRVKRKRIIRVVRGTVDACSWCGALWCGVPLVSSNDRYPVGSVVEFDLRSRDEFDRGEALRIAM